MDHSKFDCHVGKELLELEHRFYNSCSPSHKLRKLLTWQKTNIGKTANGVRYKTMFTRMSGDQNTGLGNSIINYAMTRAMLNKLNIKHCLYIDGDDFLVFVDKINENMIDPAWYNQFGMSTKLDNIAHQMEHIDFCQTRPVFNGESYTMVRNPIRMLERLQWGVGKFAESYIVNYLTSVGMCCLSLGMGLPVEQYIGSKLASLGGRRVRTDMDYSANKMKIRPSKATLQPPSMAVRLSYEEAWGFSIPFQHLLENLSVDLEPRIEPLALPQYESKSIETEEGYNVPLWSLTAR